MELSIVHLLGTYRYWILFPLAFFEGPITAILVGFFVSLGVLEPFAAYGLLVAGDIASNALYYSLGRFGHRSELVRKYGGKIGITEGRFAVVEWLWRKHPGKTMWTGKLAYGLSAWLLMSAGLTKLGVGRFVFWAVSVTLVQYGILMALGFLFGHSYGNITHIVTGVEVAVAAAVIFGVLYFASARFIHRQFMREEREAEAAVELKASEGSRSKSGTAEDSTL